MAFVMKGLRGLRDGLADALVIDDDERDEDGNLIVYPHTDSEGEEDGTGSGGPGTTHRRIPSSNSAGSNNSASAVSQLHADVYKERHERVRDELALFREEAAATAAHLRSELERLKARGVDESGGSNGSGDGTTGAGGGGGGGGGGGDVAKSRELEDLRDEVASLNAAKAALAESLAEERRRNAGLCDSVDAAQAEKREAELRWERYQHAARAHVGALRAKYPDLSAHSSSDDNANNQAEGATAADSSSSNNDNNSNSSRALLEDLILLKQAINDAVVKTAPAGRHRTTEANGGGGGSGDSGGDRGDGSVILWPLDLRIAPAQAFARALQQLVRSVVLHGGGGGGGGSLEDAGLLRLKVERLRLRLAASDEARAAAVTTAEEVSRAMGERLLRAEEGAEVLRRQRAAGEARQDQLIEQVATLCREKDEALDQKQRVQAALQEAEQQVARARADTAASERRAGEQGKELAQLRAELEKKNVTWDEYALFQARLEESDDLCRQQAERLAVLALERDEAVATVERLRQQHSVMRDRVAALSSDLAIRDEDARQGATQLQNLGAAMQRLEMEAQARREALQAELAELGGRLAAMGDARAGEIAAAVQACRSETEADLRLRDLKLTQQAGELQVCTYVHR
jgi:hypothetical protein